MTPIAPHITAYLRERLPLERRASPHTCDTYAYAFQLLFEFASDRLGTQPSDLQLEHIDAPLILAFLEHIQEIRGNSASTRNARLAAIKSFMRYVEHRVPAALDQIRQVLAIPVQRTECRIVRHLTVTEQQALLDAPEPTTRSGVRDRALFHLAIAGGLRVSELVGLRVNARGGPLTRSGVAHILRLHTTAAKASCPSLADKAASPHVLRHSCAMNVLRSTGSTRKVALWLGHEHEETTEIYLPADPSEKLEVLRDFIPPTLRPGKFRPPDKLLAALRGG